MYHSRVNAVYISTCHLGVLFHAAVPSVFECTECNDGTIDGCTVATCAAGYRHVGLTGTLATDPSLQCRDGGNDCCASEPAGEPAACADGWVPSRQPQSHDGCPNYRCFPPGECCTWAQHVSLPPNVTIVDAELALFGCSATDNDPARCRDGGNDCCASEPAGEPAVCDDGWVPSTQPQSHDGCPNYACLPATSGYIDVIGASPSSCIQCAPGMSAPLGATSCTSCVAGRFDNDDSAATPCRACGSGQFSEAGAIACISCNTISFASPSVSTCHECTAGVASNCRDATCSDGYYSYSEIDSRCCVDDTEERLSTDAGCSCAVGYGLQSGTCTACTETDFSSETSQL